MSAATPTFDPLAFFNLNSIKRYFADSLATVFQPLRKTNLSARTNCILDEQWYESSYSEGPFSTADVAGFVRDADRPESVASKFHCRDSVTKQRVPFSHYINANCVYVRYNRVVDRKRTKATAHVRGSVVEIYEYSGMDELDDYQVSDVTQGEYDWVLRQAADTRVLIAQGQVPKRKTLAVNQIQKSINPDDAHEAIHSLVQSLEDQNVSRDEVVRILDSQIRELRGVVA